VHGSQTITLLRGAVVRAYDSLTPRGKVHRLRQLTPVALAHYDIPDAQLVFLSQGDNLVFRVDAHDRFVLRIHISKRHSAAMLSSELLWLAALRQDTRLLVPTPVRTVQGTLVAEIADARVPETYSCVLFDWLPGRHKFTSIRPVDFYQIGSFMSHLHRQSERYVIPPGFTRPRWDWEAVYGESSSLWLKGASIFSAQDQALLRQVAARLRSKMDTLGEGSHVFGLIHSDLNLSNLLFAKGAVAAIDFEECAWGYYLSDIAVTLYQIEQLGPHAQTLRTAFFEGYEAVRSLPDGYKDQLDSFMLLRTLTLVAEILDWPYPTLRPWGPRFLATAMQQVQQYLTKGD
jgi:Ser/Thr protein kinase RdoA (MazF antagonist)